MNPALPKPRPLRPLIAAGRALKSRRLGVLQVALFLCAAWFIAPFADIRRSPAFNADSAIIMTMATESVPLSEEVYYWGQVRRGTPRSFLGKLVVATLGSEALVAFLNTFIVVMVLLGSMVAVPIRSNGQRRLLWLPLGILLPLSGFTSESSWRSLDFMILDIGLGPEIFPLLLSLSVLAAQRSLALSPCELEPAAGKSQRRFDGIFSFALLAAICVWVSDLALIYVAFFALVFSSRALFRRGRPPFAVLAGLLACVVVPPLLRALSEYGQATSYQSFASVTAIRQGLGSAVLNLAETLPAATWMALAAIPMLFGILIIADKTVRRPLVTDWLVWHGAALFAASVFCLLIFFVSGWFYHQGEHPRYFVPPLPLIALAATQLAVVAVAHFFTSAEKTWKTSPLGLALLAALLVPLAVKASEVLEARATRGAAPSSPRYRASEALRDAGCRGVVGNYWNSYVYVVGAPGVIKATTHDGIEDRSKTNTRNVLSQEIVCVVGDSAASFADEQYSVRGVKLLAIPEAVPRELPDGRFFKPYRRTGELLIDVGDSLARTFLVSGWSKRDETNGLASFVRTVAADVEIAVPLKVAAPCDLAVNLAAQPAGSPSSVRVSVNETPIGEFTIDGSAEFKPHRLTIPARSVRPLNRIVLHFGGVRASVDWIRFVPLTP